MEGVLNLLGDHEDLLHSIAARLLEKETLEGDEFMELISAEKPDAEAART